MLVKINCIYNDQGAWCTNKKIKRSLWGAGARCCIIYPYSNRFCEYKKEFSKPKISPPAPKPKKQ